MNPDNAVLTRRLAGAAVLLLLAFGVSLILPDPSKPPQTEPGIQRVELHVADGSPIDPTEKSRPARSLQTTEEQAESANGGADASPQSLDMAVSPEMEMPAASDDEPAESPAATSAEVATAARSPVQKPAPAPALAPAPVKPQPSKPVTSPVAKPQPPQTAVPPALTPKPAVVATPKAPPVVVSAPPPEKTPEPPVVAPTAGPRSTLTIPIPPPVEPSTPLPTPPPPPAITATPAPVPATKLAAAAASAKSWQIQAGVYADIDNARQVQSQLTALGYAATLSIIEAGGSARYRIRCGPFATRDQAEAARKRLEQSHIPASLVAEGG